MTEKKLHRLFHSFRKLRPWYFLVLLLISVTVSVFSLRANDENMVKLRSAVFAADKNNTNVQAALQNLRSYVYSHMNTNIASGSSAVYPPIQLKYTYNRLVAAEQAKVNAANAGVYTAAEYYCQKLNPVSFSGRTRVPCVEAYVKQHGQQVQPIPSALYEFDFISPTWSPDLAGFSVVASSLFLVLFIFSFIDQHWLAGKRKFPK